MWVNKGNTEEIKIFYCAWEMIKAHKILVERPKGKTPLGKPGSRWEDNLRIDLRETGWEGVDWTHLAQKRDQ